VIRSRISILGLALALLCVPSPAQADPVAYDTLTSFLQSHSLDESRALVDEAFENPETFEDFVNYLEILSPAVLSDVPMHAFQALLERAGLTPAQAYQVALSLEKTNRDPWSQVLWNNSWNKYFGLATAGFLLTQQWMVAAALASGILFHTTLRTLFKLIVEVPHHRELFKTIDKAFPEGSCPAGLANLAYAKIRIARR